ncbi:MAG TPA: CapA family protein [Candidatus Binatia bacterium]|nr:CapA family protein [Candidatus Binatia bacterium]
MSPLRRPTAAVLGILALALAVQLLGIGFGPSGGGPSPAGPTPSALVGAVSPSPTQAPSPSPTATPTPNPPSPSPSPSPRQPAVEPVAIVPVTSFRNPWTTTDAAELRAVLAGTSRRYAALELVAAEADAILATLDAPRPTGKTLVLAPDAAAVATDLAAHRDRIALLRAEAVGPAVRALAWGEASLFGVDRVRDLAAWPLTADLPPAAAPFDPATTWTLVAGGDILLDRGVAKTVKIDGRGIDFPFDGGYAEITSRYCCSAFGWKLPRAKRLGGAGAVRHLLTKADLALANFENPAPDRFRYHTSGTVFSADPALVEGLARAGIDWVSLGNNHIGDAGRAGIVQTRRNVERTGIAVSGAGANLAEAHTPAWLEAGGLRIAVFGYDTIARYYAATEDRPGSAQLTAAAARADIAAARRAGADLVIVYPHWGVEYRATPTAAQRRLAHAVVDAGADLVIGNHAHWAAAMEVYEGKPIWYALGNFVFDQTWSEPTMEGILLELTFRGRELVQIRLHPFIILDRAQPNFMDPADSGAVVLRQVFDASKGLLPW